jgi:hypothetical protein
MWELNERRAMFDVKAVMERIDRIENCILQYKEGAIIANELAVSIVNISVELMENTPTVQQLFPESFIND